MIKTQVNSHSRCGNDETPTNTPCLNKNCATTHSFTRLTNVDRFSYFFTVVFSMKFATKSMLYISPHFKGVTPLPCKTQKDRNWHNSATRNAITLV